MSNGSNRPKVVIAAALLGAVVGGVISGATAYWVADRQLKNANSTQERVQKRGPYLGFLTAVDTLSTELGNVRAGSVNAEMQSILLNDYRAIITAKAALFASGSSAAIHTAVQMVAHVKAQLDAVASASSAQSTQAGSQVVSDEANFISIMKRETSP